MGYTILSGRYETGSQEQQMSFKQLFGINNVEEKFDLYFHWFNIIHELGHILLDLHKVHLDKVEEELFVNCFAVAYWKKVGCLNNLERVHKTVNNVLDHIPNPIPKDLTFQDFFKSIWGSDELNTVMMYGYFQMSCVAEAFKIDKSLADILSEIGYKNMDLKKFELYSEIVTSDNSHKVLNHCIENLKRIGVTVPDVKIELVDNPEVQCCQF